MRRCVCLSKVSGAEGGYLRVEVLTGGCLVTASSPVNEDFYQELHSYIGPQLTNIASDISEHFMSESSTTNSNKPISDEQQLASAVKYLFFNELNCQHTGTVHLNQKILKKKAAIPMDIMNLLNDLYVRDAKKSNSSEIVVKTLNDYWIVKRTSNCRHSFIVFNKSSTLLEVSDDANKLFDQHLSDVFLGA